MGECQCTAWISRQPCSSKEGARCVAVVVLVLLWLLGGTTEKQPVCASMTHLSLTCQHTPFLLARSYTSTTSPAAVADLEAQAAEQDARNAALAPPGLPAAGHVPALMGPAVLMGAPIRPPGYHPPAGVWGCTYIECVCVCGGLLRVESVQRLVCWAAFTGAVDWGWFE